MNEPIQKPRIVKTAGTASPLYVQSLRSNCGTIENGIAFCFKGQGAWVVDIDDLKSIITEADAQPKIS